MNGPAALVPHRKHVAKADSSSDGRLPPDSGFGGDKYMFGNEHFQTSARAGAPCRVGSVEREGCSSKKVITPNYGALVPEDADATN